MKVLFKNRAEKELSRLEKGVQARVYGKIMALVENPYPIGSQKLEGDEAYRIRVGDYRVIYTIDKVNSVATIVRIAHRREVYKP